MRVVGLRIENFRGIRSGSLTFSKHNVLLGQNNCGKTTVIEALTLLFGRDRLLRELTEHDFFGGDPQPRDRLRLVATISEFDLDDPARYPNWFREERAIPKWVDPANGALHPARTDPRWKLACQIGFAARFDRPSLEVHAVRYFHDDEEVQDVFAEDVRTLVPASVIRELGFYLVPANRTWDRIVSFGSELFRRVITAGGGPPSDAVIEARNALRTPAAPLERDRNLDGIVAEFNNELAKFYHTAPKLRLRLTSTDSEGVLEAVVPHYGFENEASSLPARRQGSGLVSLQGLLLLLQFGRQRAEAGDGFWMALEEPELHVPPPLQRSLVKRIQALSTQTFITTHSPMIAAMSDPRAVTFLRNEAGQLAAVSFRPAALPPETPNSIRRLFEIHRLETIAALIHDVALIPEGLIDRDWLDLLGRELDVHQNWDEADPCSFGAHIGVIPTQEAALVRSYEFLQPLHPNVACLVDGDAAGRAYAARLKGLPLPPRTVIRWPDDQSIEDVVGWICEGDAVGIIHALQASLAPESVAQLVARLKTTDRPAGLKQDRLSYQLIAEAMGSLPGCLARVRELLDALTDVLLGKATVRFVPDGAGVMVFAP